MSLVTGLRAEEYLAGDWERHTQLVGGEVVVTDPRFWHQELVFRILRSLREWCEGPGRGMAGFGGNWVLGPGDVYCPDVWWLADPGRLDLRALSHDGGPDLAVEVRSPSTWHFDIGRKRSVYESAGVGELWLVDHPAQAVLVARRSEPKSPTFDVSAEVGPGEALTSPLLPGFGLAVDELFA